MIKKPIYLKSLFINHLTSKGKKQKSENSLLNTIKHTQKICLRNHKILLKLLIIKTAPVIKIKQIKGYRKNKQVDFPFILKKSLRYRQSIKIIIKSSNINAVKNKFDFKLSHEIVTSVKDLNKKVRNTHEYAFNLKKFANFRWFI